MVYAEYESDLTAHRNNLLRIVQDNPADLKDFITGESITVKQALFSVEIHLEVALFLGPPPLLEEVLQLLARGWSKFIGSMTIEEVSDALFVVEKCRQFELVDVASIATSAATKFESEDESGYLAFCLGLFPMIGFGVEQSDSLGLY
jgi:hypothetical protein